MTNPADKDSKLDNIRHSLAHLLATAVLEYDPKVKLAIGPTIENGFYYDFEFSKDKAPTPEDLPTLKARMQELIKENLSFEQIKIDEKEAKEHFKDQPYKLELIDEIIEKGEKLTLYKTGLPVRERTQTGDFIDLCRGGHVENTKEIDSKSFALTSVAGAYWRGDEKNTMLTRIYGVAFSSKAELDEYLAMQEEAEKRDHRKLGKELDLFTFSDVVGKGLPLWTYRGSAIRRELERFIVDEEIKRGYQHVYTPDIAKIDLYKKSGHYPYYKESMYAPIKVDDEEFMLRPMTCPHHFELYLDKPRSYRELPIRIAEVAKLYRYEQSGELSGLMRVRGFCLADAHIICKDEEQAVQETGGALDLIEHIAGVFGLEMGKDYRYRLSLGDRANETKYYKNDIAWDESESALRKLLKDRKCHFVEEEDEAAFYGPKIDIQMKNVRGKEDTAFTVQYDFCMPDRFDLTYNDTDGSKKRAIVIHRSSIGAIERTVAFLIEHYGGVFPLWLSPVQVKVLPISDAHKEYAAEISQKLRENGIRVELDESDETLGKKIRQTKLEKVPYFLVIGDKEIEKKMVKIEQYSGDTVGEMSPEDFILKLKKEIADKK